MPLDQQPSGLPGIGLVLALLLVLEGEARFGEGQELIVRAQVVPLELLGEVLQLRLSAVAVRLGVAQRLARLRRLCM